MSVPAAIQFHLCLRYRRRRVLRDTRQAIGELTGLEQICPDAPEWPKGQTATIPLYTPERSGVGVPACDPEKLK